MNTYNLNNYTQSSTTTTNLKDNAMELSFLQIPRQLSSLSPAVDNKTFQTQLS